MGYPAGIVERSGHSTSRFQSRLGVNSGAIPSSRVVNSGMSWRTTNVVVNGGGPARVSLSSVRDPLISWFELTGLSPVSLVTGWNSKKVTFNP